MTSAKSPWQRVKDAYLNIPALARDFGIAVLVILLLMGGLWVFTGQPASQAPLVVVESGSMMHLDQPWGRLGTIDPGDLILVKDVDEADKFDIVTAYGARSSTNDRHPGEGDREGYGLEGDVVIYNQDQCPRQDPTPIIHRAMTWVEVEGTGSGRTYSYHDEQGNWLQGQDSVHLPAIGLSNVDDFARSGWITKGDNPETNRPADQVVICRDTLIQPEWIIGKARGEVPWVGLLKFMVQGNNVPNAPPDWCRRGNAVAPCDLFEALFLTLFVLVAIPLVWDGVNRLRHRGGGGDKGGPGGEERLANAPPERTEPSKGPPPDQRPRWDGTERDQ